MKKFFILFFIVLLFIGIINLSYAESMKDQLNECLCECGCEQAGWACGIVSCTYNPEPAGGSPICADPSNGVCVCQGYGCGRADMATEGECYDRCMELYGGAVCGDGICERDKGEDCSTCADDCDCSSYEPCGTYCEGDNLYVGHREGEYCQYDATWCEYGCKDGHCLEGSCEGVQCRDHFCEEGIYYDGGYCDPKDGQCHYNKYNCTYGCDDKGEKCAEKKKEIDTKIPKMDLYISNKIILIEGKNQAKIKVCLNKDGKPLTGKKIYIRIEDPKMTGVLGMWGLRDAVRYTRDDGCMEGTLTLPTIKNIKSIYYNEFPYNLNLEVTAIEHSSDEEWKITKKDYITVESPAPRIINVSIDPDPAISGGVHNVHIKIEDPDSNEFIYMIRNYGGKWLWHSGEISASDSVYGFRSNRKEEIIQWQAPERGLNREETIMAKEMEGTLKGLTINLVFSGSEEAAKRAAIKYGEKKIGGYLVNFVPIINSGKTVYGLWGNTKTIAKDVYKISDSKSFKEAAYRTLHVTLEGGKTTIGVVTLMGKQIPVIGGLAGATQDLIDSLIGTVQSKVNDLAEKERIRKAKKMIGTYGFVIVVKDNEGNIGRYYYPYEMEYYWFKED